MRVSIKLWGATAYYSPEGKGKFSLVRSFSGEKTVHEVVKELGLPEELHYILAVNNRVVDEGYVLKDGDEVALFTPNSGG